jgi:uncharacterized protein (TIGR00255 family)
MYISMTGFGGAQSEREWGTISLELSSVNHRYQEIFVRLPKELASWEPWFHQKLRAAFRRGKVSARVDILWAASALSGAIDRGVLLQYYREISEIRDALGQERDISLDALINLPGVLDAGARIQIARGEGTEEMLSDLLARAEANWKEMRAAEGSHLETAVREHLTSLENLTGEIEAKWQGAKDTAFEAMCGRIRKALEASGVAPPDDARFAQEAAILADRWDVSEELARLASHIKKFRETGQSGDSVGRRLDFLAQEMNREANTINSKVADADIRWLSVEARAAIERIREQIQNIE